MIFRNPWMVVNKLSNFSWRRSTVYISWNWTRSSKKHNLKHLFFHKKWCRSWILFVEFQLNLLGGTFFGVKKCTPPPNKTNTSPLKKWMVSNPFLLKIVAFEKGRSLLSSRRWFPFHSLVHLLSFHRFTMASCQKLGVFCVCYFFRGEMFGEFLHDELCYTVHFYGDN